MLIPLKMRCEVKSFLNNSRQSTLWKIPGLPPEKEKQMRNFFNAANAAHA
jgi:hypothetical protein